jgi:uncharacterized membrane protein
MSAKPAAALSVSEKDAPGAVEEEAVSGTPGSLQKVSAGTEAAAALYRSPVDVDGDTFFDASGGTCTRMYC